jgi:hypothetical protein
MKKFQSNIKDEWIVFDIDGTLSVTLDTDDYNSLNLSQKRYFNKIVYRPFEKRDIFKEAWVMARTNLSELLNYCFNNYRVGVWSIGQPGYVDVVTNHLFGNYKPEFVYNFKHCYREYNPIRFSKPLSKSPAIGGIIIEDSQEVVDSQDKSFIIERFNIYDEKSLSESDDTSLEDVIDFNILLNDNCLVDLIDILSKNTVKRSIDKYFT